MQLDLDSLRRADIIVVGSGFFGATIAERAANELGAKVCVIEKRRHLGGNSHSETCPQTGIECHTYGTHIFHTNSRDVWDYINKFTSFTGYRHHVMTNHKGIIYQLPINLGTMCAFFGRHLSPKQARALIAEQIARERFDAPRNFEEKAISLIGRPLYEAFIEGYTRKQWQTDPRELPGEIITRLPVRYTFNSRYFSDHYEGMPLNGYTAIFDRMFNAESIGFSTGIDWFDLDYTPASHQLLIYTGPIDRFFNYQCGELGWRTIDFDREIHAMADFQGISVMNYADADILFTRIHEFRHLHPERSYKDEITVIFKEYSRKAQKNDEPYYPIGTMPDQTTFHKYRAMSDHLENVIMGGRLGDYRYYDMHQAIGAALKCFSTKVRCFLENRRA